MRQREHPHAVSLLVCAIVEFDGHFVQLACAYGYAVFSSFHLILDDGEKLDRVLVGQRPYLGRLSVQLTNDLGVVKHIWEFSFMVYTVSLMGPVRRPRHLQRYRAGPPRRGLTVYGDNTQTRSFQYRECACPSEAHPLHCSCGITL
jgi:hypothetical protein